MIDRKASDTVLGYR